MQPFQIRSSSAAGHPTLITFFGYWVTHGPASVEVEPSEVSEGLVGCAYANAKTGLKKFTLSDIFCLPNCSCFVLMIPMSSTLYQDPSLIIPQRPVRVRFQTRRTGLDKARSAMRDFTLLLALAWGAAEMALWLSGG
jgi:hypothetical protein